MDNFKKIIKTEIFNDIKKSKVVKQKIEFLFKAFVGNKDVFWEVQNYFDKHILVTPSFKEADKNQISSLLKKYWLIAWTTKPLIQKDMEVINVYFDSYSYLQQNRLKECIKKDLGKKRFKY